MYRVYRVFVCVAVAIAFGATAGHAFFVNEEIEPAVKPSFALSGVHNTVTQLGVGTPSSVAGFGENLPLTESLDMILPNGWKHSPSEQVDLAKYRATWQSEGTWVEVLEDLGQKNNLRFLVDWDQHQVLVTKADPAAPVAVASVKAKAAEARKQIASAQSDNSKDAQAKARTKGPAMKTWVLEPGSMKVQLAKWAESEGWQLVWAPTYDRKDLVSSVRAEFQAASFLDAVRVVVEHLSQSEGIALRSHAYKANKVLLVKGE